MIKNERQYRITKSQSAKFAETLTKLKEKSKGVDPLILKAQEEALKSQLQDIQNDIEEYDELRSGKIPILELRSLEELPYTLIKARISLGMSQKDLAELVGLKEQQIQRYESTDYSTANITRIQELIKALNIKVSENVRFPSDKISMDSFFKKMNSVGLNRDFLLNKLLSPSLATYLENKTDDLAPHLLGLQAASHVGKVFGWKPEEILGNSPLHLDTSIIPGVSFKKPKRVNEQRLNAYTVYAHYVALLIIQATKHLSPKKLPENPYEINKTIIENYGSLTLENLVQYVWKQGIAVVALDDIGSFHAACFHEDERQVIILKQRTQSQSRWMFDLLHELWHVIKNPSEQLVHASPESKETSEYEEETSDEERKASQFAGAALLGKNPQKLAEACIKEGKRDIGKLKIAIKNVAQKEGVPVDALANYMAFRLSLEEYNMWGIAENLQEVGNDPRIIIRNILLEHVDLSTLSNPDLDLLRHALSIKEMTVNG